MAGTWLGPHNHCCGLEGTLARLSCLWDSLEQAAVPGRRAAALIPWCLGAGGWHGHPSERGSAPRPQGRRVLHSAQDAPGAADTTRPVLRGQSVTSPAPSPGTGQPQARGFGAGGAQQARPWRAEQDMHTPSVPGNGSDNHTCLFT